jgi:hypothetical protein
VWVARRTTDATRRREEPMIFRRILGYAMVLSPLVAGLVYLITQTL